MKIRVRIIITARLDSEPDKEDANDRKKNNHNKKERGGEARPMVEGLHVNKAVDNADTRTDQRNQHEAKNQRIAGNSADKVTDLTNSTGYKRTDIGDHGSNSVSCGSTLKNHPFIII